MIKVIHLLVLILNSLFCLVYAQKNGDVCNLPGGGTGTCISLEGCLQTIFPQLEPDKVCEWNQENAIVCCEMPDIIHKRIEAPDKSKCPNLFRCGYEYAMPLHTLTDDEGKHHIYHYNRTIEKLKNEGFEINVLDMTSDAVIAFNYTNGSFSDTKKLISYSGISPVGGKPALGHRALYMALLGTRRLNEINWLCDGVLVSKQWVLSAAHCFVGVRQEINVVRLGEKDLTKEPTHRYDNHPIDFQISEIIIHPEYKSGVGYHDLVLLKISKEIGQLQHSMAPICLPWGVESTINHFGSIMTMSGWGATHFGGSKIHLLLEVDLEIFNTAFCEERYSELTDFAHKYPFGMDGDNILCAGSREGGKDACKGDSGAPLVYQNIVTTYKEHSIYGPIILAGIVSSGFGCGLKDYPGLYIPINNPKYLQWIKNNVFPEC